MRPLLLLVTLWLGACAIVPDTAEEAALRERPDRPGVHADLVRGMLQQGQYYAALAHVEELERSRRGSDHELLLLRAAALYQLDEIPAARQAYQELLRTEYAGQAHHGLALILARDQLGAAVTHFNSAVALLPTDPQIRNDLGYTLLLAGRLTEARHHLATAAELAPGSDTAKSNLVLAEFLADRPQQARLLAQRHGIPAQRQRELQAESVLIARLINQRAAEFTAPGDTAGATAEQHDEGSQQLNQRRRTGIPGLYESGR